MRALQNYILFYSVKIIHVVGTVPLQALEGGKSAFFVEAPFFWRKRRRAPAGKVGENGAHGADACP